MLNTTPKKNKITLSILAAFIIPQLCLIPSLKAEVYIYTDKDGIIHFTNIPPTSTTPKPQVDKDNTFDWTDKIGVLRKIHKLDVTKYDHYILDAAKYYSLPPSFIKAVIAVESSFETDAISPAGAMGLMQLIPSTAKEMRVSSPWESKQNIFGGTRYLRILANQFQGKLQHTLAAYNAGPTAVRKAKGVPKYKETQKYVKRVLKLYYYYVKNKDPASSTIETKPIY